ncbi:MAG: fibronectin type III domain-containing protein [Steroidobacteraceae bacterium]
MLVAGSAWAGAGCGDTTNPLPDASSTCQLAPGVYGVRTYYANSPQGMQFDALTGLPTRDTGTALRKFVDPLPGLVTPGGNGIPLAVPDTSTYSDADYYEIAVVEYAQRMHSDLAKATTLRGYVQIDPAATDAAAIPQLNNGAITPAGANGASQNVALFNLDGSPVMISRPHNNDGTFVQVQAHAFAYPRYLGPTIIATHGRPTRVKFYNALPAGHGFMDATGWHRQGDLFIPVDHTLFGGGDGQTQTGYKDLLCGDVLAGPNNAGDPTLSACAGGPNADGSPNTPVGYVHVPKFEFYTENREELHLHGGDNPWISDGHPHQWITPAADELNVAEAQNYKRGDIAYNVPDMPNPGPGAVTYYWPNGQSGRLLFYHDHATGLTRLNVYAGTAAGYLLADPSERAINALVGGDTHEIPLVIQDKTFVPKDIATEDAKWDPTHWGQEGDLWFPHVYETNQDPLSADATNPVGRWDGASFFWPVFPQIYATPSGEYGNATTTPEAFMDTPIVNGMAYPTVTVQPEAYRFRILGVGNDRMLNLSLFVADSTQVPVDQSGGSAPPVLNTEVKMVPFSSPNSPTITTYTCPDGVSTGQTVGTINANGTIVAAGYTESGPNNKGITNYNISFPCGPTSASDITRGGLTGTGWGQADNRPGGVPDPATMGPNIIRIGNEGGLFQKSVVIPPSPINYEYNKRSVTVLNVLERGLWLGPAERADVVIDFSQYAGKTLILYNDSGAPVPAGDPRIDYYTGDGDQTGAGGAPETVAGYGPNTRTIMQINVANTAAAAPINLAALDSQLLAAYVATQPKPVVPTPEYAPMGGVMGFSTTAPLEHIFTGSIYLNKYNALTFPAAADVFNYTPAPVCSSTATCRTALAIIRNGPNSGMVQSVVGSPVSAYVESKAIQELFEADYGRMNAILGVELPFTSVNIQTTIPLAYVDPATETIANGETQFWKITHNGVDSHPVHFHFINVQVINRVGWDGTIKPIPADEAGWKETVKMHPLEDVIVAVRAKTAPPTPFGMPHSWRQPAPNQLASDNHGITQIDAATGNAPAVPYTNAAVDYGSEYVWHCHILGHEENDFMRPFIFKAKEVLAPTFTVTGATTPSVGAPPVTVTWLDPTPIPAVLTAYDPIGNPTGFLGNPNNEIGFRVERSPGNVAVTASTFVPVPNGLRAINVITKLMNAPANATTYTDTSVATAVTLAAPGAPSAATATDTTVTLTFPALPAGAGGFLVYRDGALVTPTAITTATWTDTALTPGTSYAYTLVAVATVPLPYTYRVAAVTAAGDTLSTTAASAGVTPANSAQGLPRAVVTVPAPPTGLAFTAITATGATGNWAAALGATSYQLHQGTTATGPWTAIAPTSATSQAVTGLSGNSTYYFQVDASNASGASAFGPTPAVSLLTLPNAPGTPVVGVITSSSVALSWAAPVGGAATYSVQYSTTVAFTTFTSTAPAAALNATVSGLAAATPYYFRVVANNATGSSVASASVTATTLPGLPLAPTGLVFSNVTATTVTASWTASAGATSYDVTVNGGAVVNVATPTYPLTALSGNTTYAFSIRARNVSGVSAGALTGSQLTLPAAPGTPVAGAITSSSVALSWAAPAGGAASYTVQYSTNGFATFTSTAAAAATSATVTGLTASTPYSFRVVANNATGSSVPSGAVSATTLAGGVSAPPAPTLGAVTTTNVRLSWAAIPGATSYRLYRNGVLVWTGTATTRNQGGQVAGNTYSFTLTVTTAAGTSPQSAATLATTLPSRPATPTVSTAGNTAANHLVTVTVPAKPATATAAITYTIWYQFRATTAVPWGAVTVIRTGIPATAAAQAIPLNMPGAGRYRFSLVAVDAGGSSAASGNSATAISL